jgi:hypothetical protein
MTRLDAGRARRPTRRLTGLAAGLPARPSARRLNTDDGRSLTSAASARYPAGWVNRHQQHVIEYLVEENRALREQLRGRRVRLTDDQRRRLAAKGQRLGRQVLRQVATIVTPDTILRWYRRLIAQKWTSESRRPGRPGLMKEIASLIVRMAAENPAWGL